MNLWWWYTNRLGYSLQKMNKTRTYLQQITKNAYEQQQKNPFIIATGDET